MENARTQHTRTSGPDQRNHNPSAPLIAQDRWGAMMRDSFTKLERARSALGSLDPSTDRETWVRHGMSAKAAGLDFDDFHQWSAVAGNYKNEGDCRTVWNSIKEGSITARSLFRSALATGWIDESNTKARNGSRQGASIAKPSPSPPTPVKHAANAYAVEIWKRCVPATLADPYINRKGGKPDGLRVYPVNAISLVICGRNVGGYLTVPCWSGTQLQTVQFIPQDQGDKLNLPGASFNDGFFTIGAINDLAYICEGIGQAWAINQATGAGAVVCFGAGRIATVAKTLRATYATARLVIVPDKGKETEAAKIAAAVAGQIVAMPDDKPSNYDANDYAQEFGTGALSDLLGYAKAPPIEYPLSVAFADELPDSFTPPDEVVQGVLTAGDCSMWYGDSNSGKTFAMIDLCCAVARGVPWLGRTTESGLVVYLAAESPASVRSRLQAYQKHHIVRVPNFVIVQSSIDLFEGDADTNKVIQLVDQIAKQRGIAVRLIVGDTLARLSAGANENAGQDMGLVVRRIDRIRTECNAHFALIHHSGKNAAAGSRGWSGVRAAVDTEVEVTDSPSGRCCEITKQRDLPTKGERIGFRLDVVVLGQTKWGAPASSCVVVAADVPIKTTGKRIGEIGGAILECLRASELGKQKKEVVAHFAGRYTKPAVYREIKKLVEAGQVLDLLNVVSVKKVPNSAN